MPTAVTTDRIANLDNRLLVGALWAVLMAVFLAGELLSPFRYADPQFVIDYLKTELVITGLLVATTALFLPARRIGLRLPVRLFTLRAMPMYALLLVALAGWLATRYSLASLPADDMNQALLELRTTAFVGVNEEWIFRGLLFAAFARWWGMRRGAFAAIAAFSAFHLLNIAAGVPPLLALVQLVNTFLMGSVFLVGALATGSLLLPMIVHALYDFAVMDAHRLAAAGADAMPILVVPVIGLALGALCLFWMSRLTDGEPFPQD